VILDARNDRRSAIEFFVNPRGIQDDFVVNDATGNEDPAPISSGTPPARSRKTAGRSRSAFPSLPCGTEVEIPRLGLMLYRNYPRDFRYQMFNVVCLAGPTASSAAKWS